MNIFILIVILLLTSRYICDAVKEDQLIPNKYRLRICSNFSTSCTSEAQTPILSAPSCSNMQTIQQMIEHPVYKHQAMKK
jgi:hypothetical protein